MKKVFLLIGTLVIVLIAALGYATFQNQKQTQTPKQPLPPIEAENNRQSNISPSPTPILSPIASSLTKTDLQENIKASVNSKNTQAMASYMTNPVHVILQATECCGEQTPDEAVAQASYVEGGIPFNFDQGNETIKNLKAKNPELANTFIGISQNMEHLIAFTTNNQNKISQIRFAVSWKLFAY